MKFPSLISQAGQTLADLVVSLGIGGVISLTIAGLLTFGLEQFNALREQNLAQENILHSAYYMRYFLGQAVKIKCCGATLGGKACQGLGSTTALPAGYMPDSLATDFDPVGIPMGAMDCRDETVNTWSGGNAVPLAIFVREDGVGSSIAANPTCDYKMTGIYFEKPVAPTATQPGTQGTLYFVTGIPDTADPTKVNMTVDKSGIFFDHLVNVGIRPSSVVRAPRLVLPNQTTESDFEPLQSVDIHIKARYYKRYFGSPDYTETPAGTPGIFRDIEMTFTVGLRNNILGYRAEGSLIGNNLLTTPERLNGGIYYFKLTAPPLSSFRW